MKFFNIFSICSVVILSTLVTGELLVPSIWPQPKIYTQGTGSLHVQPLRFTTTNGDISTLTEAYERYHKIMFPHAIDDSKKPSIVGAHTVKVTVKDISEGYPQIDTDESYVLDIQTRDEAIELTANTVYGALRGLETLSQLVLFDYEQETYFISAIPIHIEDAPRYPHRGLLLDTARHYQPIEFIQSTIDALSYAKYNVLHWHVVDKQSFPFESITYPKLWDGSYTKQERYTQADIYELVEYARKRGIKIMIEFDMPGHAGSWCAGYPDICPSKICHQPLNPASNETFALIESLLGECAGTTIPKALFPYGLLHLGGDEVSYACWLASSEIQQWQTEQGYTSSEETYKYFVDRAATITRGLNRLPVQWVEVFEHFGNTLDKDTIVHVWKEKSTMDGVLKAGYRSLLSNQDDWYLDHLTTTWQTMYLNEPTAGLSVESDPKLIMGGESCMWGETVDPSDVQNTIWPRAAAVAEVLWTPLEVMYPSGDLTKQPNLSVVESRLQTFRCLLTQRGIAAAPVNNAEARDAPPEPGSCYAQRRQRV